MGNRAATDGTLSKGGSDLDRFVGQHTVSVLAHGCSLAAKENKRLDVTVDR